MSLPDPGEHGHFPPSSVPIRPRLTWPGGAPVAVVIFLHFESADLDVPADAVADPRWRERAWPDVRQLSFLEYGNRVAIVRVLDLLDRLGVPVTVAANALACERHPHLVEAFRARGYDLAARGLSANQMVTSSLSPNAEIVAIAETLARIERIAGHRPVGWAGQDHGESARTPTVLAQAGLQYVADWPNDDQPFQMLGANRLISIPAPYEFDDMRLFIERRLQAWTFPPMLAAALDTLEAEGTKHARCLPIAIHPWVWGAPHRIRYLEEALSAAVRRPGVWFAPAAEVAAIAAQPNSIEEQA